MDRLSTVERFWAKVAKSDGCWEWTASLARGYGVLWNYEEKRQVVASRYSWELHNGPIPAGLWVCHHCDNPKCVKPEHLFLGRSHDNILDSMAKGRFTPANKTQCKSGHPFTADNTIISYRTLDGVVHKRRDCLLCTRKSARESYRRNGAQIRAKHRDYYKRVRTGLGHDVVKERPHIWVV